jgi:hypothetical protein
MGSQRSSATKKLAIFSPFTAIGGWRLWPPRRELNGLSWRNQVSHAPLPHGMVGRFTRRYLPELTHVPNGFLQEPWK